MSTQIAPTHCAPLIRRALFCTLQIFKSQAWKQGEMATSIKRFKGSYKHLFFIPYKLTSASITALKRPVGGDQGLRWKTTESIFSWLLSAVSSTKNGNTVLTNKCAAARHFSFSSPCSLHGTHTLADYSMWLMSQIFMTLSEPVVRRWPRVRSRCMWTIECFASWNVAIEVRSSSVMTTWHSSQTRTSNS